MDQRSLIVIIANSCPPYRVHLHRRIARELPGIRLASLFTHEVSSAPWKFTLSEEIGPVVFGQGEPTDWQGDWRRAWHEWRKGGRIARWMQQHRPRAVVISGYNDAGRLRVIFWCRRRGIPCFIAADSNVLLDDARGLKRLIKQSLLRRVLRASAGALVCGRRGRDFFLRYGESPDRIHLFPLVADFDLIEAVSAAQIQQARSRYGLPSDRRHIVFSGRLVDLKRVDLLLEAFKTIADRRPQWDLLIIGDGPLRESLQASVPGELGDRVRWLGFIDDQAIISAIYRLCDVLVLPSDFDQWALVIVEAAAAGLAIIASDIVGAAAELVDEGINGRVFRRGDMHHLAECLLDVTDLLNLPGMKTSSLKIVRRWRECCDPIVGLRRALESYGITCG